MDLKQMTLTITHLQSSGLRGAVLYEYFDRITFVLTDKRSSPGVMRMLARLEFRAGTDPMEVPRDSGMALIRFIHRDTERGLALVEFDGPVLGTLMQYEGCWFHTPSWMDVEQGAHFTIVGTPSSLSAYRARLLELMPSDIGLSISSSMRAAFILAPSLSNRRTEVLSAAVEMGYYGHPRACTQSDIAEVLGVSQGTVAEHLQLAEAAVMSSWARQRNEII